MTATSDAATDHTALDAAVQTLYAVLSMPASSRDWTRLAAACAEDVRFTSVLPGALLGAPASDGVLQSFDLEAFRRSVEETMGERVFTERQLELQVTHVRANTAHVLSRFEARFEPPLVTPLGPVDALSGVNSIDLWRSGNAWKIVHVFWEYDVQ